MQAAAKAACRYFKIDKRDMQAAPVMILLPCILVAVVLLLAGSACDLALRIVPNRICLALGLDGLVSQSVAHTLPISIVVMMGVFIPAAVCWRHGFMGGGDVKLLASSTLLVRPDAVPMLVLAVALAGGVLALLYLTMARLLTSGAAPCPQHLLNRIFRIERYRIRRSLSLPYAVAICAGTLYVLGRSLAS